MPFPADIFRQKLAQWFERDARPLPWRTQPSLYRTVVSEFMLQQTQVVTVVPYFERWMERFPDFGSLAAAEEEAVLHSWQGLGYYSRARNLHRLAQQLVRLPQYPTTATDWQKLPGVGPYTAAAIASIAMGDAIAVVDGNVVRILSRLHADASKRLPAAAVRHYQTEAQRLLDPAAPGRHNEAMMELGATLCSRRNPLCTICPVVSLCAAARTGAPERFPTLARKQTQTLSVDRLWILSGDNLLLARNGGNAKRLANVAELPRREVIPGLVAKGKKIAVHKRGISNQRITETIYQIPAETLPGKPAVTEDDTTLIWVRLDQLASVTLSGPHRKWITSILSASNRTR